MRRSTRWMMGVTALSLGAMMMGCSAQQPEWIKSGVNVGSSSKTTKISQAVRRKQAIHNALGVMVRQKYHLPETSMISLDMRHERQDVIRVEKIRIDNRSVVPERPIRVIVDAEWKDLRTGLVVVRIKEIR